MPSQCNHIIFYSLDTESLVSGLQGCNRLKTLKVEGNPVYEDPNCRQVNNGISNHLLFVQEAAVKFVTRRFFA